MMRARDMTLCCAAPSARGADASGSPLRLNFQALDKAASPCGLRRPVRRPRHAVPTPQSRNFG
eukprot:10674135-Alexandrium_andersonii.AAC.1